MNSADTRAMAGSASYGPTRDALLRATHASPAPADEKPAGLGDVQDNRVNGWRSKLERDYARHLDWLKETGSVLWWAYEPCRLRLADGAYYKPDFAVLLSDGRTEYVEVKGFWREAARVRIKVAAELHPYAFIAATREGGQWRHEHFAACRDRIADLAARR